MKVERMKVKKMKKEVKETREIKVRELEIDLETGRLKISFIDKRGEEVEIEAIILRKDGKLVSYIPNWFTKDDIKHYLKEFHPDIEADDVQSQALLKFIEQKYDGFLAEATNEYFLEAFERAISNGGLLAMAVAEIKGEL